MVTGRRNSAALAVIAIAAALWILSSFSAVIIPLVVAIVLAVLVQALVDTIQSRWRWMPDWLVMATAALAIIAGTSTAIYVLGQGATSIVQQGPALIDRVQGLLHDVGRSVGVARPVELSALIGDISLAQFAGALLSVVQGLFSALVVVLVYFIFLLLERKKGPRKIANIVGSRERSAAVLKELEQVATDIEVYIWVQTLTGLLLAAGSAMVMFAVGLDNALFWTFVLFLLSFIPIIGVTVGSVAPALFALLQFPTYWQAIAVFGGIQVVAFVIGNFFYPRMQAATQNISPVATMLALAFWTALWGLPGSFLAVPLTLMVMLVCAKFNNWRWVAILLSDTGTPESAAAAARKDMDAKSGA